MIDQNMYSYFPYTNTLNAMHSPHPRLVLLSYFLDYKEQPDAHASARWETLRILMRKDWVPKMGFNSGRTASSHSITLYQPAESSWVRKLRTSKMANRHREPSRKLKVNSREYKYNIPVVLGLPYPRIKAYSAAFSYSHIISSIRLLFSSCVVSLLFSITVLLLMILLAFSSMQ